MWLKSKVKYTALRTQLSLFVIRANGLGYWDQNYWKRGIILIAREPNEPNPPSTPNDPNKGFSLQPAPIASEILLCGNFVKANFRPGEISRVRIFAPTKFRQNEISPRWQRNFVWLKESSRALGRNYVAKFRRVFARTKNEKHRISFAFLLHSTVCATLFTNLIDVCI